MELASLTVLRSLLTARNPPSLAQGPAERMPSQFKHIDANTFEATLTKAGKVIGTAKSEISKDGRVTTVTAQGTNQTANQRSVRLSTTYDKQ